MITWCPKIYVLGHRINWSIPKVWLDLPFEEIQNCHCFKILATTCIVLRQIDNVQIIRIRTIESIEGIIRLFGDYIVGKFMMTADNVS